MMTFVARLLTSMMMCFWHLAGAGTVASSWQLPASQAAVRIWLPSAIIRRAVLQADSVSDVGQGGGFYIRH